MEELVAAVRWGEAAATKFVGFVVDSSPRPTALRNGGRTAS